jgi:peptide methionine sulfoxide reductase msrA/msrB
MTNRRCLTLAAILTAAACTSSQADPPKRMAKPNGPRETAVLAAGCFWGVEHWMMKADGVADVEVGYVGGTSSKVGYEDVSSGSTGHAEAVRIVFDPTVTSYEQLLVWFFKIHDPTTKNRQGNDVGSQYRSAIFPVTDAQRVVAEQLKTRIERSGAWRRPITTTIEAPTNWVSAEAYHQDYLVKHPGGYDNHFLRPLVF